MAHIKFGNVDFSTEEMFIFSGGAYSAPVRDVTREAVLGRNGDIIVDNGRYMNTTARFVVNVQGDVPRNIERLKYMLYSQKGYQRLYDSTAKDFYRMACFTDGFELTNADGGNILLTFNCKPHKYSISGDEWQDILNEGGTQEKVIVNPFFENALPLIYVKEASSGVVVVNDVSVVIKNSKGELYIDAENKNAYYKRGETGAIYNANNVINTTDVFLKHGENTVYASEGLTAKIMPRWCTI